MIFITVGTEKFPFDRFIRAIDEALISRELTGEVFAQTGNSLYDPKALACKKFIEFTEMTDQIKRADVVVSHAGVGSVILSLTLGKIPVIFPRRHDLNEHLDDHQLEFAKMMEKALKAVVAYDEKELIYKIKNYHDITANLKLSVGSTRARLIEYLQNTCAQGKR